MMLNKRIFDIPLLIFCNAYKERGIGRQGKKECREQCGKNSNRNIGEKFTENARQNHHRHKDDQGNSRTRNHREFEFIDCQKHRHARTKSEPSFFGGLLDNHKRKIYGNTKGENKRKIGHEIEREIEPIERENRYQEGKRNRDSCDK